MESISSDRMQYLILFVLSLLVLSFVVVLYSANKQIFQRFLGRINPLIAFLFVIVLGGILFYFLLSENWFAFYEKGTLKEYSQLSGMAALFGIIMILVDRKIIFPADMNILFPESLLFYPAIGFFAEILFHVFPLTALLFILNATFTQANFENLVWICILIVACIEPFYQSRTMVSANRYPKWAVIYVGLHVFLINFLQLLFFWKYDFISMYFFRLVYYAFWHIGWGKVRLRLLF